MADDGAPPLKRLKKAGAAPAVESTAVDANDVITFYFLDARKEPRTIEEASSFHPDMCHQFFGDDEEIKGYEGLEISVWLSQRSYEALLEVRYSSKRPDADDIEAALREKFTNGLATTRQDYLKKLQGAAPLNVASLGPPILQHGVGGGGNLAVYRAHLSKADQTVRDLHARLQPLLMFFVDGANFIDPSEPEWDLLLALRTEDDIVTVAGFATIYNFYCFPDRNRIRVSQVLVPPPNQGQGVGKALLEAVYSIADEQGALDITYEDPTDTVQAMRERIELQRAAKLPWLMQLAASNAKAVGASCATGASAQANGAGAGALPLLQLQEQARAQANLRVSKQQVRKLWEVLLYQQAGWEATQREHLVEGLVRARLVGSVTSTKRVAEGKRIFDLPGGGFMMTKVPDGVGIGPGAGMPVAMESEDAEGQSPEEREAALNEAVRARMDDLKSLISYIQPSP